MTKRRDWLMCGAAGLAGLGLVAVSLTLPARAAPLDNETCEQLKREVVDLEGIGARANLAKGPVWGRANLTSAQLEQVKKLIEIDEAVLFRCPRPKPVPAVAPAAAAAAAKAKRPPKGAPKVMAGEGENAAPGQAPAKPKVRAAAKPAAPAQQGTASQPQAPAGATATGQGASGGPAQPPRPRPKAAATKPQDAFTPPAKAAAPAQ